MEPGQLGDNRHLEIYVVNDVPVTLRPLRCPCLTMNDAAGNSSSVGTVGGPFATGQPDPEAPNLQIDALNLTCVSNLQAIPPPQTQPGAKTYKMTFNFTSALTKSFSPIVCATHRSNGAAFAVGSLASPGALSRHDHRGRLLTFAGGRSGSPRRVRRRHVPDQGAE